MSCVPGRKQFRLLNRLIGWDENDFQGLTGLHESTGLQLDSLVDINHTVNGSSLSGWLPPPNLARICGRCEWFMATPWPPRSRLLRWNVCEPCWKEPLPGVHETLRGARALAVSPTRIAVTDAVAESILLFTDRGRRQLGRIHFRQPGAIAYASWREWLVVDEAAGVLQRLDMAGSWLGTFQAPLPTDMPEAVDRVAVDDDCRVWIAVDTGDERFELWQAKRSDTEFKKTTFAELQQAFGYNGLAAVTDDGFCFEENDDLTVVTGIGPKDAPPDDEAANRGRDCGPCFNWYGRPIQALSKPAPPQLYEEKGQLLTLAIDSGIPRCRWHRVRIEADIPSGTTVAAAVSSNEEKAPEFQGVPDEGWPGFNPGVPHPKDWQKADLNRVDFLIQQPPGRYLFLRLRLTGDGFNTPRVRQIRLDFPRQTSLDLLPFVYRENAAVEDFSERFLSLFDAFLENTDEMIERLPALLDTAGVPDAVLPWLGHFLDIAMDPAWDADRRRRILLAAPKLYRMRGTVDGMRVAVKLVFDVEPVIQELPQERQWGAVGDARLARGVRLFGRSSWRFSLGRSRLSQAPLRSFGDPDRDPFNALAYRFNVMVPLVLDKKTRMRLQLLIDWQKPAHTMVTLRDIDVSFVLGRQIKLGIHTIFKPFAPTVLRRDEMGVYLCRGSVLSPARLATNSGLKLDRGAAVGVGGALG